MIVPQKYLVDAVSLYPRSLPSAATRMLPLVNVDEYSIASTV